MTPQRVKKDVHAIILDFIRSRPPLHPVGIHIKMSSLQIYVQHLSTSNLFYLNGYRI